MLSDMHTLAQCSQPEWETEQQRILAMPPADTTPADQQTVSPGCAKSRLQRHRRTGMLVEVPFIDRHQVLVEVQPALSGW